MSPRLALHLLGIPELILDSTPVTMDRRKAVALLAYLAMNRGKHTRELLSGLFWPDYEQAKAFSNLRRTIWEVHQAIGEDWLIADRESVSLNREAEIDLDVARFQELLSESRQQNDPKMRINLLSESAKLYRNHFLTGFSLKDSYSFNEWAYAESEELRRQLAEALTTLSEDYCMLGQAEKAIPYARRLISLDPLNESAHRQLMEVYIQAGQHSAALKQYQTCEQILRNELNLDPQPETRALYKKIRKGEMKPVRIGEKAELIEPKHNLPLQLSSFIGREKETEDVANLLARNRLVTLAGVGGIGKTRLALQIGQKILSDYPDGVWLIPLDSLSDPTLLPQTVASVFEIREAPNRPILEILINVLREKAVLLVLDNCEHLLEACAQLITTLLTKCPNIKVLATSRETLNIAGEAICYTPTLSLPEQVNTPLEALAEYEAVKLFVERALLAFSSFTLTKKNAQTVANICRCVDGIPLAIELAAARVNILQVEEILKQLGDSFALLASDNRIALQRHQTLQASMDWSWRLLTEPEQIFLNKLSVFAGGWTIESSQAVSGGNILDLTSALVKKSLIMVNQKSEGETRYYFHEIVRQYMRERLIESGEEEDTRTRHLLYFLQLSEQAEPALRGPTQIEWMSRLNDERDNLRAALEWAEKTDVEAGLCLSGSLFALGEGFNLPEGVRWLTSFTQKPEAKRYPRARAKALCALGWSLQWLEQFDEAHAAAEKCLDLYKACGDQYGETDGLTLLGTIIYWPVASDLPTLQQAFSLSQILKDTWRQAQVLGRMGQLKGPRHPQRISYWKKAIALFKKVGDFRRATGFMSVLGYDELLNGNIESAQKWLDELVSLNQQLNRESTGWALLGAYARLASIRGDHKQARAYLQTAITNAEKGGDRMVWLWNRSHLGYLALREGDLREAHKILTEITQEFFADKNEIGVVFTLEGMAGLYIAVHKPQHAARLIGWSDAMREKTDDKRPRLEQADVDKIIAACLAKLGDVAFSDAYDEGQKMTLDEAVAYALGEN